MLIGQPDPSPPPTSIPATASSDYSRCHSPEFRLKFAPRKSNSSHVSPEIGRTRTRLGRCRWASADSCVFCFMNKQRLGGGDWSKRRLYTARTSRRTRVQHSPAGQKLKNESLGQRSPIASSASSRLAGGTDFHPKPTLEAPISRNVFVLQKHSLCDHWTYPSSLLPMALEHKRLESSSERFSWAHFGGQL